MNYPRRSFPKLRSPGFISGRSKASRRRAKRLFIEPLEHRRLLTVFDLTKATGMPSQTVNNAIFERFNPGTSAGTGVIKAFFSVDKDGTEQGYNTDAPVGNHATDPVLADAGSDTTSLLLSAIPKVTIGGITYREFALDINQTSQSLLSLDSLQLYLTNVPNLGDTAHGQPAYPFTSPPVGTQVTKIYDIGASNYILLDAKDAGSGSGRFDMDMLVPDSLFTAAFTPIYVTLYNKFGVHNASNDGFEEWAVGQNQQPITGTIEGFKFNDLNGNGVPNNFDQPGGEPGVNGVTINLYQDMNGDGQLTAADGGPIQTTTTSTVVVNGTSYDGLYSFQNVLPAATYFVREVAPSGSTQTSTNPPAITINAGDIYLPSTDPRFVIGGAGEHTQNLLAFGNFFVHATTLGTTIHNAADNSALTGSPPHAALGTSVYDTATVGGTVPGVTPTGTVTYEFFSTINGTGSHVDQVVTLSGGAIPNSSVHGPLAAGSYSFIAIYSGDSNYTGSTSDVEPLIVDKGTITLNTTIHNAADNSVVTTALPLGSSVVDTASFSGATAGFTPTIGNVTYTFNAAAAGSGAQSSTEGPLGAGNYTFKAHFSGDANYNVADSADEPLAMNKGTITLNTTIHNAADNSVVTSVSVGSSVYDTASFSGATAGFTPTLGNVTYTFNAAAAGSGAQSSTEGPLGAGNYIFKASFSGDANYNLATSEDEPLSVDKAGPKIATTPGGLVIVGSGSKLTDTADLEGGYNPTGTITFTLYDPSNVVVYTDHVTVNGNGNYSTATGDNPGGYLPTVTGTYEWVASYSGDVNNKPASGEQGDEPEVVDPANPTIVTITGGTVIVGSGNKLNDTADLEGGFNPGGTITFVLYDPSNAVVYTDHVTVNGNGNYSTATGDNPGGYLPTVTGIYEWVASYSGDVNNNEVRSEFGEEPEMVSPASPTITTTTGGTVVFGTSAKLTDTADLEGGFNETGTITFTLYNPSNTVVDTETVTVNGNGTYSTPAGFVPTVTGTYQWVASYSGDTNNNAVSSAKGDEPETVIIPNFNFIVLGEDAAAELNDSSVHDQVTVVDKTMSNKVLVQFNAYDPSYRAGVRVALADMDGDGVPEIITAPGRLYNQEGPNHQNEIRVFKLDFSVDPDHPTVSELTQFRVNAYGSNVNGGVQVAVGDVNHDGWNDIVTVPTRGPEEIKVFLNHNGTSIVTTPARDIQQTQYGFSKSFIGGAVIGVADMGTFNGTSEVKVNKQSTLDGYGEIIVGNGSGMAPTIKIINLDFKNHPNQINYAKVVRTINPFNSKFRGGVFFDLGRINGDAIPDLVVSTGNSGKSMVEIRNGCTGALIKSFQAYHDTTAPIPTPDNQQSPVRVALLDIDGDGIADQIVTVQGTDGKSRDIKFWKNLLTGPVVDHVLHEDDPSLFGDYFEEFIAVSGLSSQQHQQVLR